MIRCTLRGWEQNVQSHVYCPVAVEENVSSTFFYFGSNNIILVVLYLLWNLLNNTCKRKKGVCSIPTPNNKKKVSRYLFNVEYLFKPLKTHPCSIFFHEKNLFIPCGLDATLHLGFSSAQIYEYANLPHPSSAQVYLLTFNYTQTHSPLLETLSDNMSLQLDYVIKQLIMLITANKPCFQSSALTS